MNEEVNNLLASAKHICIIPSPSQNSESMAAALALFYTLKEAGKNVNLIPGEFPEKLTFLIPSIDFLSAPKNAVISIPKAAADVSQIYYEKNEEALKIHLTVDRGQMKKDAMSVYFEETKPDLVITLGIQNFQEALAGKLDSFGYLLGSPILNIDNHPANLKFGAHNIMEEKSLAEIVLNTFASMPNKNAANCLLAGLMIHYEHFKSKKTGPAVFNLVASLITHGAEYGTMIEKLTL